LANKASISLEAATAVEAWGWTAVVRGLVTTIQTEASAVLNNTADNSVRRVVRVVLREVWRWVVKATTAIIMVVLYRAVVHSLEIQGVQMVDLTAVEEALAAGREFGGFSLTCSYQALIATPITSVYIRSCR
jgi:hypothetical protein